MAHISDIKLIRTDTTLDLSQKAEKGMISSAVSVSTLYHVLLYKWSYLAMWYSSSLHFFNYLITEFRLST
ncbi:Serine/threonine-protein kinase ZRK7 [Linum grandiflorum]